MPPPSVATTARPLANASMITRPRPSGQDGSTSTVDASSCSETASGSSHSWCSTRPGKSATSASTTDRCEPLPTITRAGCGQLRRDAAARRRRARRRSCTSRARRRTRPSAARAAATGSRSANAERSLNAVKTALGGTPRDLLDEVGGEGRDRSRRVRPPDGVRPDRVCERADQPARRRAVQARERPPVAVHLDDHRHPPTGERPARQRGRAEKGIGREDRVWPEAADLAPKPQRQAEVEEEAVEPPRPRRPRQPKAAVARPAVGGRRSEDAVVELLSTASHFFASQAGSGSR